MPYTLKHSGTGTLLAGFQMNGYQLSYYGIFLWELPPEPEQMEEALTRAGIDASDPVVQPERWETLEVTEHEAKMANVKLRNDPRRAIYHRNGAFQATSL